MKTPDEIKDALLAARLARQELEAEETEPLTDEELREMMEYSIRQLRELGLEDD